MTPSSLGQCGESAWDDKGLPSRLGEWSALIAGEGRGKENYLVTPNKTGGGGHEKAPTTAVKQAGLPARTQGARLKHGHMHNTARPWVRVGGGDAQVGKNEHQRVSLQTMFWVGPSGSGSDLGTPRCRGPGLGEAYTPRPLLACHSFK